MQDINKNVADIRNGIHYVRSTTNRLKSFELRVETGKITRGSVPLDVTTRWNSTYLMLEQALKFRLAFDKMEAEDKPYNEYFLKIVDGEKRIGPPTSVDWEAVDRLVQFLIIFYNSILVLSASNSVSSYKLYNEIVTITRNISALAYSPGPDESLRTKASLMLGKLDKYWDSFGVRVEMNKLVIVASVFNPMNKMKFAQLCFEKLYGKDSAEAKQLYDEVLNILTRLFNEYSTLLNKTGSGGLATSCQSQVTSTTSGQPQPQEQVFQRSVLGYERMNDIYKELVQETGIEDSTTSELDLYLKEGVENPKLQKDVDYNVLFWWNSNSAKFPVLSLVAKDILAMQVSSVASESAFSTSGRILEPFRSCLTHYMIEVLMCTEQWMKCDLKANEKGVTRLEHMLAEVQLQDDLMRGNFFCPFNSFSVLLCNIELNFCSFFCA